MRPTVTSRRLRALRRSSGQAAAVVMAFAGCLGLPARANAQVQPPLRPAIIVVPFDSEGRDPRGYWLREA